MRIKIELTMPPPQPQKEEVKECGHERLLKKVEHAIECIELDEPNWGEAVEFIRQVARKLEAQPKMRPEYLKILDLTRPVLSMFGTYGDQDGED